jgi:hypothetical protein
MGGFMISGWIVRTNTVSSGNRMSQPATLGNSNPSKFPTKQSKSVCKERYKSYYLHSILVPLTLEMLEPIRSWALINLQTLKMILENLSLLVNVEVVRHIMASFPLLNAELHLNTNS